MSLKSILLKK